MEDKKKEVRKASFPVSVSEGEESRGIEGYAILFNTPSDGLPFEEVIERSALDGVIERSDVFALLNHSIEKGVLARSKKGQGSLSLSIDAKGLRYKFDAPNTALGNELLENIRRKEVSESSFAFDVASDTWEKKSDGTLKRTIHKIEYLYDVSPVYDAAYSKTTVYQRSYEAAKKDIEKRENNLETYYSQFEKSLNI